MRQEPGLIGNPDIRSLFAIGNERISAMAMLNPLSATPGVRLHPVKHLAEARAASPIDW